MRTIGLGLALGSIIPWLLLPGLALLPLSLGQRAIGAAGLLVLAEVMFWLGVALAGQDLVRHYRSKLSWRGLRASVRRWLPWGRL
jgi:hypothetical protein